jgi:c-di-GMP-binding flagellar brake protein YcgR
MDESYRSLLPLIRLRSESPTWLLMLAVSLLALMVLIPLVYVLVHRHRSQRQLWEAFRASALERGLDEAQIQLLVRMARQDRLRQPLLLLSSLRTFEAHVTRRNGDAGRLEQIGRIRHLLHFDRASPDRPLLSTRQLEPGQALMVWPVKGGPQGFLQCVLVGRDEHALYAAPLLREGERHLCALEEGERLKVRFWREGDTEYRFRTRILATRPQATTIAIGHTDRLERIQKRDFFRLDVHFELALRLVPPPEEIEPPEPRTMAGTVVDISGGGLGLLAAEPVAEGALLEVDPQYQGPFPLAGLRCEVIKRRKHPRGWSLGLEFVHLSPRREGEIVRAIYQHQLERVLA